MSGLLAIDLGLKTGLALFGADGRLVWYRSQNFGKPARLKRAIPGLLREIGPLAWIVTEGDRNLGQLWHKAAEKRDIAIRHLGAETWRQSLLIARQRRSGVEAKRHADTLARQLIDLDGAPKPTGPLKHDAAEAILIGLWGVMEVGLRDDFEGTRGDAP